MIVQEDPVLRWPSSKSIEVISSFNIIPDIDIPLCKKQEEQDTTCVKPEHMTLSYVSSMMQTKTNNNKKQSPKKIKKRTVTSYDHETSFYLKSVFFEVYSYQKKLTKQQRKEVQKKTGLASRNITYWFSNHKRRFHKTLKIYREAVESSNGSIKNYNDFITWRRKQGLPDQISLDEV